MNDPYADKPQIQADRWSEMNTTELNGQRELLLEKITLLSTMMSNTQTAPQALRDMYGALQMGLTDVTLLLDKKTSSV